MPAMVAKIGLSLKRKYKMYHKLISLGTQHISVLLILANAHGRSGEKQGEDRMKFMTVEYKTPLTINLGNVVIKYCMESKHGRTSFPLSLSHSSLQEMKHIKYDDYFNPIKSPQHKPPFKRTTCV